MLFTCVFVTLGDRLKIWLFNIAKFIGNYADEVTFILGFLGKINGSSQRNFTTRDFCLALRKTLDEQFLCTLMD